MADFKYLRALDQNGCKFGNFFTFFICLNLPKPLFSKPNSTQWAIIWKIRSYKYFLVKYWPSVVSG